MNGKRLPRAALALGGVLLAVNIWQGWRVAELRRALDGAEERLAALEESRIWEDSFQASGLRVDGGKRMLAVSVSAALPGEQEAVEIRAYPPGLAYRSYLWECTAERNEEGVYAGEISLPLELDWPVEFAAVWDGGKQRTALGRVDSLAELLPVQLAFAEGSVHYNKEDGLFYWCEWAFMFEDGRGEPAEAGDLTLRAYRNGELAAENAALPPNDEGVYWDGEESTCLACGPGDRIEFCLAYGDGSGMRYELPIRQWEIRESREEERLLAGARPRLME